MTTTTRTRTRAPYTVGDRCRFIFNGGAMGTCLTNGTVTAVAEHPTRPGDWKVTTVAVGGDVERGFTVTGTGRNDYLSRGWFDQCNRCDAAVTVRDHTGRWNKRGEVVCRDTCQPTTN